MTTYYDIPADLRGNLLEGRRKFPHRWTASDTNEAETTADRLTAVIAQGGLTPILTVTVLSDGITVQVDRKDP